MGASRELAMWRAAARKRRRGAARGGPRPRRPAPPQWQPRRLPTPTAVAEASHRTQPYRSPHTSPHGKWRYPRHSRKPCGLPYRWGSATTPSLLVAFTVIRWPQASGQRTGSPSLQPAEDWRPTTQCGRGRGPSALAGMPNADCVLTMPSGVSGCAGNRSADLDGHCLDRNVADVHTDRRDCAPLFAPKLDHGVSGGPLPCGSSSGDLTGTVVGAPGVDDPGTDGHASTAGGRDRLVRYVELRRHTDNVR